MTRTLLAVCAALLAIPPVRSAEPRPLWEIDTRTDKKLTLVQWVGVSPDGKLVLAHTTVGVPRAEGTRDGITAWDTKTHAEKFKVNDIGDPISPPGRRGNALTDDTLLLAGQGIQAVHLTDGAVSRPNLISGFTDNPAVWVNPKTRDAVWLTGEESKDEWRLAVGKFPEAKPKPGSVLLFARADSVKFTDVSDLRAITVCPQTNWVAVAARFDDSNHSVRLYSLAIGDGPKLTELATVLRPHRGPVSVMQASPDGKVLATGSDDSTVCLWAAEKAGKDWKPYATVPAGNFTVSCLAFSPDGRTLAAGTWDRKGRPNLYLIDVQGRKVVSTLRLEGEAMSVAYSADGKLFVTGNSVGKVQVWDAAAVRGD